MTTIRGGLEFLQNLGSNGKDPRIFIDFKNCFSTGKRVSWIHSPMDWIGAQFI
jgi:hypothetical protein